MKRAGPDDGELWRRVAATVRPLRAPSPPHAGAQPALWKELAATLEPQPARSGSPQPIEKGRGRRIERGREVLGGRLDLHGFDQDQARRALIAFLLDSFVQDRRAVLVITGKGSAGEGVLRRALPGWLADPRLRSVVAGFSPAHRRHGGEGALYVALKSRPRS